MEMEKSKIDLENEIIKLKSEKSQAMSKLTGTITERKKNQKVVEEEKIKLEEQVHSLSQQVEELMIVKEQKLVVDAKIEQLSTRIAEEGALHKAKINELKDRFSAQVDQLEKSLQSGESKISELQTAAQQSNEEKLQLNSAVNVLNIKIREQEGEIVKARNDYDEIKRKSANAFNEISALTNENGKLRSDREEIKKQREQMLAELKKRDAAVLEARDANEKIISALKKETDTLQKSLVSQKKLFVAQQEEGKKNADTRIQSLQLELNMIKRDYQDVSQLKATISAQTDIHNATVKELKKKVLQLESMNNHLTENLTENTLGKLQSDILSLKNAVNAELKHGLDTVKSMERNNKTLAAEVKRYQKLEMDMIEVGGVDGRISAGEARNHRLERLVDDLESYKGNSSSRPHTAKPSSGVALDNFEKEVVELTQQLLSVNRVCGRSQSMKVLSNRLQKLPTVRTSASRAASAKRTNTTF